MKKATTKRALVASVVSLLLCMSMLIGSTFAWFTDTDTTAVSNIVSGTLDIEIVDKNGNPKTDALKFVNKDGSDDILWEPGATYRTEGFQLKNVGNLWLKYTVTVNNTEVSKNKLNEVITFSLVKEDGTKIDLAGMKDIPLAPNGVTNTEGVMYIEGHMDENAGNEYQNLTLSGVSITVYAAQYTKEVDIESDQYDKDAAYDKVFFANSQSDLNDALASAPTQGDTIVNLPAGDYKLDTSLANKDITISGDKDTVIDTTAGMPSTNGADLTFEGVTIDFKEGGSYGTNGFTHAKSAVYKDCVINGTQFLYADAEFINCVFNVEGDVYAVWTYGAKNVTFTGCTFNTDGKAILVYTESAHTATINVTNCKFYGETNRSKAAVEVGESAYGNKANYTINITGSTADAGFVANKSTSNLWGNKNDMGASLVVTVDGSKVH